ncbi:hypothetical protein AGMMS49957_18310 [Synergistales bacterium]|nr:hypothetical protein AGMMS49957_18310 [Synergistales bacterium]
MRRGDRLGRPFLIDCPFLIDYPFLIDQPFLIDHPFLIDRPCLFVSRPCQGNAQKTGDRAENKR